MRFEIGPGGMFMILLGLAGLSGAVFGLGLIAGHELAGPETGSPPVTAAYPLPQTAPAASSAPPAVEASAPAVPSAPPAATAALAPPNGKTGAAGVNVAAVNPSSAPAATLKPRVAAPAVEPPARRTEPTTKVATRASRPAEEDLSAGSAVAPPRETRSAAAESAASAPSASDMDQGEEGAAPPAPPRRRVAAVSPPAPHTASGPYSVQIDAMMDWQGAQQMAQKIRAKGFQPYIVPTYVQGKTWYRLRVGHYATPEQAQAAESRLHEEFNQ